MAQTRCRMPDIGTGAPEARTHRFFMRSASRAACILCLLCLCARVYAADPAAAVAGLERRYAAVETAAGGFRQIYRAPGIEQEESGVFRLKKPGLMRWEYREPEAKLFVADGRECFLYVPQDRQVTVQALTAADIRRTPLSFLLGGGNIGKRFAVSWETEIPPAFAQTLRIRLRPLAYEDAYVFLVLELDAATSDIRRVVVREHSGNTSEFLLSNVETNVKVSARDFQFKPPKGVEIVRLDQ